MRSKICMNEMCRATTSSEWKKGWSLKSGGLATLCNNCGPAYENLVFCEKFHSAESGWRECRICSKNIHCGCIASKYRYEYMDFGGVACLSCAKRSKVPFVQSMQVIGQSQNATLSPMIPLDLPNVTFVANGIKEAPPIVIENRPDDTSFSTPHLTKAVVASESDPTSLEQLKRKEEPVPKTVESNLDPLPSSTGEPSSLVEGDNIGPKDMLEQVKGQIVEYIPPKCNIVSVSDPHNKATVSQPRVARPPAKGRGRNHLLQRYWPRITDQELKKLSGVLKSTIVPLFEKIVSASDAGRIGRLVLPKACAEAYFPRITQPEGIPIRIQDINGNEWTFQFRFWPNNNSRMYVLEGITPCIQNMQVEAGDTVIFSKIEPGGQLVIGCRKASSDAYVQDSQIPAIANESPGVTSLPGPAGNLPPNEVRNSDDSIPSHILTISDNNKTRNMKNRRLLIHNDDALELKITWEEAQELFIPSPNARSTVVMVEEHEFEEFDEPPIFGRRTCLETTKGLKRCSFSAPQDTNPSDLESPLEINKDSRKRRVSDEKATEEVEPSGLDALATAAVLGDNLVEFSVEPTTRHPRHRPGCTCIVCIQPPSGTGRHETTCKCNVCSTVRRRFKTLMMRKKKRLPEHHTAQGKDKHKENEMNQMDLDDVEKGGLDLNCDPAPQLEDRDNFAAKGGSTSGDIENN